MEHVAERLLKQNLDELILSIERMETGLANYVFLVKTSERSYILRISPDKYEKSTREEGYWLKKLIPLNIPIPRIIKSGVFDEYSYAILNYIPGSDLGHVYRHLSETEKKSIAQDLCEIQKKVATLPMAEGFGFLSSYADGNFKKTWREVLEEHIIRSRDWIAQNEVFDPEKCDITWEYLDRFHPYFDSIRPLPFLDDATTKNVLIDKGRLSGIVDIDSLCFGDALFTPALTYMSLRNMGQDTHYIEYWLSEMSITDEQKSVFDFYTLLFCLNFMGEIGMQFANGKVTHWCEDDKTRLEALYDSLLLR